MKNLILFTFFVLFTAPAFGQAAIISPPVLEIVFMGTDVRLTFPTQPERLYQIEKAASATGPWTALDAPLVGSGAKLQYLTRASLVGAAYFRVAVLP
jgi:hypothetical protein